MRSDLTLREREAIALSATEGTRRTAEIMGIGIQRVKNLRCDGYKKLGVSGPHALILAIRKLGWF